MPLTVRDMVMAAQKVVPSVTPSEVCRKLEAGEPFVILDVREREEYEQGHIAGATLLPRGLLEFRFEQVIPDKHANIVLH
jgi:rhodanese-related sulfurtransferase